MSLTRFLTRGAVAASLVAMGLSVVGPVGAAHPLMVIDRPAAVVLGATPVRTVTNISFPLVLAPRDPAEIQKLLIEQQTPGSPEYHHFLAKGEFATKFAPRTSARTLVVTYLRGFNLRVRTNSRSPFVLSVAGSTAQIQKAFHARIASFKLRGAINSQFTTPAMLPADVGHAIAGLYSMNSVASPHSYAVVNAHDATPATTCSSASAAASADGGYDALSQAQAYGLTAAYAKGFTGVGQRIAVYELAPYISSALSTYFSCYGISPTVNYIPVDAPNGGVQGATCPSYPQPCDMSEPNLDIEEVGALAPGAIIDVYSAPNDSWGPLQAYTQIAADDRDSIVTTSWGNCEADSSPQSEAPIFDQMALQGQTVFAASGDSGSTDCYGDATRHAGSLAVDDPGSQPTVTSVGALTVPWQNTIQNSFSPANESVWSSGRQGSGGGKSAVWPRQSWEVAPGVASSDTRSVPDISVMGDPNTGFVMYDGSWSQIGGTSIGSPLMAALTAVAAQSCSPTASGNRLGFLNPTLYRMARMGVGLDDITRGHNDTLYGGPLSTSFYPATRGYDMASGLGAPNATTFLAGLCAPSPSSATSTLTVNAGSMLSPTLNGLLTVRDVRGNPLPDETVTWSVSRAGAVLIPATTVTNANGQIAFTIQNVTAGVLSVTASTGGRLAVSGGALINGTTLVTNSTTVTGGGSWLSAGTILQSIGNANPVATDLSGARVVAAGKSLSGALLIASSTRSGAVNLTSKFKLKTISNPRIACTPTNCAVAFTTGGHLDVILGADTNTPSLIDVTALNTHVTGVGGFTLTNDATTGTVSLAYLTTAGHLDTVKYLTSNKTWVWTDLTTQLKLPVGSLTPAMVGSLSGAVVIAFHSGNVDEVVTNTPSWNATNVIAATHASNIVLTGSPLLTINQGLLALWSTVRNGPPELFSASSAAPMIITSASSIGTIATSQIAIINGVNGNDVLFVGSGATVNVAWRAGTWHVAPASQYFSPATVKFPTSGWSVGAPTFLVITNQSQSPVI